VVLVVGDYGDYDTDVSTRILVVFLHFVGILRNLKGNRVDKREESKRCSFYFDQCLHV